MPAQNITVVPPALVQASTSAAATAEHAAAPSPAAVPVAAAGSPADAALATIAAAIATRTAKMTAELAGKGPHLAAAAQTGVTNLQSQDEQNGAHIQAVGQSSDDWEDDDWIEWPPRDMGGAAAGPGAIGPVPASVISPTGFQTSLGDGWDDEAEEDMLVPPGWVQDWTGKWSPPVVTITGAIGGGGPRAPL